ncbi:MAG: hypothetical protein Q8T09_13125 [Candidatus Melainabacteria bacterium]|nr:hypothetical protein [Candidatus Melainabacteria bacterium]
MIELQPLCDKYGMLFKPIDNPFVSAQVPPGQYVRATQSVCDCGTPLGSSATKDNRGKSKDAGESAHAVAVAKLKKKGWSQAKIDRWQAEKETASERSSMQRANSSGADLKSWCQFIKAFLTASEGKALGLILHWYSGSLDDEKIQINSIEHIPVTEELEKNLLSIREDVLYLFSMAPT